MATSQNGYAVLDTNRTTGALPRLRKWVIPGTGRYVYLRDGSAGFLLAHVALWFHENIEKLGVGTWDEWGWAVRNVRGSTTSISNHASGTAVDLNATLHPRGRTARATFSAAEIAKIHTQLKVYGGALRWGGDYTGTPDGMHFELNVSLAAAEKVARDLWDSPYGARVLDANPGAASVIWDGNVPTPVTPAKPTPTPAPKPTPAPAKVERLAVDYSYAHAKMNPAAVKAAGYRGVVRYLSGDAAKDVTATEARQLLTAGLWLLLVWEKSAQRAAAGRAAGVADAQAADAEADRIGYPRAAAVMYAVDWDADPTKVAAYFEGIKATSKRPVGVYGSARVVDAVVGKGFAVHGWQTVAWSKGAITEHAQLLQRTTHAKSIKGAAAKDWDENVVLPGPVIPVWNPGEKAYTPPAPVPAPQPAPVPAPSPAPSPAPAPVPAVPPALRSTKLTVVSAQVLEQKSSDHRAVIWTIRLSSGAVVKLGHANLQGTDDFATIRGYVEWLLPQASLWTFNEATHLQTQKYLLARAGWGKYMHGLTAAATKQVDSAAVCILWDEKTWGHVTDSFEVLSRGVLKIEPTRVLPRVLLQLLATGEGLWRQAAHTEQHVDVGGKARIKGALLGQNARAKHSFAAIAADTIQATSELVHGAGPFPLHGSGDLNVAFDADRAQVLAGKGTPWFPYTVLGAIADVLTPNAHGPTHTDRLIDWGWIRQATTPTT